MIFFCRVKDDLAVMSASGACVVFVFRAGVDGIGGVDEVRLEMRSFMATNSGHTITEASDGELVFESLISSCKFRNEPTQFTCATAVWPTEKDEASSNVSYSFNSAISFACMV